MFTVEFEHDASVVRVLDETDQLDDVEMILDDEGIVFMRQWDDSLDKYEMLVMTHQQLLDIVMSLQQTEGLFMARQMGY